MTDRQMQNLRLMADPCTYTTRMTRAERDTVAAAVDEIERLRGLIDSARLHLGPPLGELVPGQRPVRAAEWREVATWVFKRLKEADRNA